MQVAKNMQALFKINKMKEVAPLDSKIYYKATIIKKYDIGDNLTNRPME